YQSLPVGKIAILSYVYPVVAVIADYFAFGHEVGGWQWLGIVMIIVAGVANARHSGARVQPPGRPQKKRAAQGGPAGDEGRNCPVRTQSQ
ncbi:MAG TPA: DMT family transporter, partial [Advenella sp.]|nr:DMT family transporter [Advenella sp.]